MTVIEVLQGSPHCWRVSANVLYEPTTHPTKAEAVSQAKRTAKKTATARIIIHNEDGSIDLLEHGYGNPDKTPPHQLSSTSGSLFPAVEESINTLLSRGAKAMIKKIEDDKPPVK